MCEVQATFWAIFGSMIQKFINLGEKFQWEMHFPVFIYPSEIRKFFKRDGKFQ